ncbi:MAG: enoyl-CoA hydratase-related protein, partial [Vicinamibacteria bacterium]
MEFQNLKLEEREGISTLTINRPDKLNALDGETLSELDRAITELSESESLRAVIVTGAGEKAFVAGADIKELARETPATGHLT